MLEARGSVMRDLGEDPAGGLEWQDPVPRWRWHSERPLGGGVGQNDQGCGRRGTGCVARDPQLQRRGRTPGQALRQAQCAMGYSQNPAPRAGTQRETQDVSAVLGSQQRWKL